MNDEQFEQEQLDRDNAYKQALARVEAQLSGAVGLLWFIQGYLEEGQDSNVKSKIRSFISRHRLDEHVQAEQQEAGPRLVSYSEKMATCTLNYKGREYYFTLDSRSDEEAQGAQAGDLVSAVRVLLEVPQLQGEQAFSAQPIIDRVRAALATQPAAAEPLAWIIESPEGCSPCKSINPIKHMAERYAAAGWSVTPLYAAPPAAAPVAAGDPVAWECYEPASEWNGYKGREYLSREKPKGCSVRAVPLGRIAAPPAAAHGDEAVRWVPCSERLPEVAQFDQQEFIVSVQRKDKVITMSALYLNAYPLYCEDHDDADDEGYVPHTGWYDAKSNGDDANCYTLVNDSWYGSTVTHWMPMPKPAAAMRAQGDGESV